MERSADLMRFSRSRFFLIFYLLLVVPNSSANGEDSKKNKFREREASDDDAGYPNIDEDALLNTQCPRNLELRWQTEVSSSIYATPLIADINSDGKLDIVVPSYVHYLEVLEGSDGEKMPGWPAFHQSTVHASPLLYDIDKDGVREIALATYNGEVLFFRVSGYIMTDKLEIPRRKVRKDWHVGLHSDPVDRSHPDVHDEQLIQDAMEAKILARDKESTSVTNGTSSPMVNNGNSTILNVSGSQTEPKLSNTQAESVVNMSHPVTEHETNITQAGSRIQLPTQRDNSTIEEPTEISNSSTGASTGRRLLEEKTQESQCPTNLELRWQTEVSSSIYATPLIADINR